MSEELQKVNAGTVLCCYNKLKVAVELVEDKRFNSKEECTELFNNIQSVARKHDAEVKFPQLVAQHQHRCSVSCGSVEDYFQINT